MLRVRLPGHRRDAASFRPPHRHSRLLRPRVAVTLAPVVPIPPSAGSCGSDHLSTQVPTMASAPLRSASTRWATDAVRSPRPKQLAFPAGFACNPQTRPLNPRFSPTTFIRRDAFSPLLQLRRAADERYSFDRPREFPVGRRGARAVTGSLATRPPSPPRIVSRRLVSRRLPWACNNAGLACEHTLSHASPPPR